MELAKLKGTEKQVNWAKAIRTDRLKVWQAADPEVFQSTESILAQQEMSDWWIPNRDKSLEEVCRLLLSGAKPKTASRKAAPSVTLKFDMKKVQAEVWETVATASGFARSGPTMDMVTGEVVADATLPF